mgnify:CR=1 FL=1
MPRPLRPRPSATPPRVSLARVLSKLGLCSRTEAARWIEAGRVEVDGRVTLNPELRVDPARNRIRVDGAPAQAAGKLYLMMNKPRGLLTTREDPEGRPTVYGVLKDSGLPWVAPVGRLDQASEGLLLFTNDTRWAERLLDPAQHVTKTYHVQVAGLPNPTELARMRSGVQDEGETLAARAVSVLRAGPKNCWLEILLEEGRNRHVRRMLGALGYETMNLVRVAIGPLALGDLPKGGVRRLTVAEKASLGSAVGPGA